MLGCHEFCGYYDWTFHFVRRRWGAAAVARLWAEAIGGESQQHYAEAGRAAGLAGLYRTWIQTGEEEACDWTFQLDEQRNVLRWDMRQCPSRGFLLAHDLNADEDYCDHCMGWMVPLLNGVGVEVWEHEHNHLGQCWGTMRLQHRASEPLSVVHDIRLDERWRRGYLDRWEQGVKQPLLPDASSARDSCGALTEWFAAAAELAIVCEPSVSRLDHAGQYKTAGLVTEAVYLQCGDLGLNPLAVLVGDDGAHCSELAARWACRDRSRLPLLLYPYWPARPAPDFLAVGLPRPVPLLPILIRSGHYVHHPRAPVPADADLLVALAQALGRPFHVWQARQGA
jgi:hypothetical protein